MSLKGSLETIALPDVLNLLAGTSKSGELHVQGGRGEGRLWFEAGVLVGFEVGRTHDPADAVFELLRMQDGQFSFIPDSFIPESAEVPDDDRRDVHPALEAAQGRFAEWTEIVSVVPSLDHQVRLVADGEDDHVVLERSQWALAVAIGGGQSVKDVLREQDLSEFEGCKALKSLVDAALAEVTEPAAVVEPAPVMEPAVAPVADGADGAEGAEGAEAVSEGAAGADGADGAEGADPVAAGAEGADPVAGPDDFEGADQAEPVADDAPASPWSVDLQPLASAWPSWGMAANGHDPHDEVSPEDGDAEPSGTEESDLVVSWADISGVADSGHELSDSEPGASDHYGALWAAAVEASEGSTSSAIEQAEVAVDDHLRDEALDRPTYGPAGNEPPAPSAPSDESGESGESDSGAGRDDYGEHRDHGDDGGDGDEPDDGRAALRALLEEMTAHPSGPVLEAQPVDALVDRGPSPSSSATGFGDGSAGEPGNGHGAGGEEDGAHPAGDVDAVLERELEAEAETEPEPAPEEPINRGLLLKFLSSVRN